MGALFTETLRFGVLGPLEVLRNGEPVRLGGGRQRALLALLLLRANELAATEMLVDQLFGEERADGAIQALYVAVSRLRRLLDDGQGGEVLVTRPGGYMLALHPGALDLEEFEGLLAEGRRLLSDGDPESAAARLREGLALWRGAPFADVASLEFVQAEIRRLEGLRLLAEMERVDADLTLGRDAELVGELEGLVALNPLQERLRCQLMTALYRAGRPTDALAVYRHTSEMLRDELGLAPSRALRELEQAILSQDASLEPSPRDVARAQPVVCPFKGLASFDRADADYFCGRERVISDLIARLASSPLVGVVGPSGIGKSSLVRAGVLASLGEGALPGSASWRQLLVRPGSHPRAELTRAFDRDQTQTFSWLRPDERRVLAIDQLEEVFTVCGDEEERAEFLSAVAAAADDPSGRALVVVALRGDFYGRVASYPRFAELLSRSHVLVGPMEREELARAIETPAARAGLEVEPELVDSLVRDVAGEPGGLPLLSTALLELWRERDGRALRSEQYRASGGVQGAVARLAEAAYGSLPEADRPVARALLLRLASGDPSSLVRRRVPIGEFERTDPTGRVLAALTDARLLTTSDGEVEVSHEALIREWPRYRGWLEEDRVGRRVEEHLRTSAREWKLRGGETADLYRGARLGAALEWAGQHGDELSPPERQFLTASQRQTEREARRLRAILAGVGILLAISIAAGIVALSQQRAARSVARVALSRELGVEAVNEPRIDVAMLLAREAVNLDRSPQTESTLLATLLRAPALIGTIPLPSSTTASLAVSPDGHTLAATDGLELRLFDTHTLGLRAALTGTAELQSPAYSVDGTLLAYRVGTTACSGNPCTFIAVRDARTLHMIARLSGPVIYQPTPVNGLSIAIAPDDRSLYYASSIGLASAHLERWTLPNGAAVAGTDIGRDPLIAFGIIDGGSRLMTVGSHSISVFEADSLRRVRTVAITPPPLSPTAAAISPDGRTVVVGSQSGSVSFVDTSTGQLRPGAQPQRAPVPILSVIYPSVSRSVVSVAGDDSVIVWDPRRRKPDEILKAPAAPVASPVGPVASTVPPVASSAISPSGSTLYSSSSDRVLLKWDLSDSRRFGSRFAAGSSSPLGDEVSPPAPPVTVSPDGSRFAVRLGASTVGLFSSSTLRPITSFTVSPPGNGITALAWSPIGDLLAVGGHVGLVQLWRTDGRPRFVRKLVGLDSRFGEAEAIQAIAFSSDGRLVAASDDNSAEPSADGSYRIDYAGVATWKTSTGTLLASHSGVKDQVPEAAQSLNPHAVIAFSPNRTLLAMSLLDGKIVILNPLTGVVVRAWGSNAGATSLTFAPDGTLAIGTPDGTIEFRNPTTGRQIGSPLVAAATAIMSIAFDRTGQRFATAGFGEGTVKLWFTATLREQGTALNTDKGSTASATFDPDGNRLLAVDDNGYGFAWPTSLASWERQACTLAGRNLSRQEWSQLIVGQPYETICP